MLGSCVTSEMPQAPPDKNKPQILATAHTETGSGLFLEAPPMAAGLCPLCFLAPVSSCRLPCSWPVF